MKQNLVYSLSLFQSIGYIFVTFTFFKCQWYNPCFTFWRLHFLQIKQMYFTSVEVEAPWGSHGGRRFLEISIFSKLVKLQIPWQIYVEQENAAAN